MTHDKQLQDAGRGGGTVTMTHDKQLQDMMSPVANALIEVIVRDLIVLVRAARAALDETEGTAAYAALVAALEPYRRVP